MTSLKELKYIYTLYVFFSCCIKIMLELFWYHLFRDWGALGSTVAGVWERLWPGRAMFSTSNGVEPGVLHCMDLSRLIS